MKSALFMFLIQAVHCGFRGTNNRYKKFHISSCTYLFGRKPKFKFCPLECDCAERISAKCNSRGLNHIPQNDRTSRITSLWLRDNTIRRLDDLSFMNWMNLRTLDLQKNNMSDVNAVSVQALKPLKKLKVKAKTLSTLSMLYFLVLVFDAKRN